jgi:4-coumarate--CoA ligase
VVDEDGCEVRGNAGRGEIYVRHPGAMMEYLHNEEGNHACREQGWFKTGDIGYCQDGKWYIVDRAKEMIKVRAWQVSPAEIEACVTSHPNVRDAAVVGFARDEDAGERPIAFVKSTLPNDHSQRLADDIMAIVRRNLASYKALDAVVFVETIPRTTSGKVLRRSLRELLRSNKSVDAGRTVDRQSSHE